MSEFVCTRHYQFDGRTQFSRGAIYEGKKSGNTVKMTTDHGTEIYFVSNCPSKHFRPIIRAEK